MGRKITQKVIAIMILTIMLLAYAATIGIYAEAVYANENSLEVQGVRTNNENVEFDAYFAKDKTKIHELESKIGEENSIYVWVAVKNAGYLKNAKVEFVSDSQDSKANFKLKELDEKNKTLAKVNTDTNVVELNQINKNNQSNIQIPICFDNKDKISINEFSRENKAKLTGIYVDANGKEKEINSEIVIKLDWTEKAEVSLEEQITKYTPYDINGKKGVMLQTLIKTSITNNVLPVKNENIEIKVPTIADMKPTSVKVGANATKATNNDISGIRFTEENYTYDETKGILSINIENTKDEQNNVTWTKSAQDEIIVTYTYDEKVLENMPEEGNKITLETKANITAYAAKEITLEKTIKNEITLKDAINNIVDFEVSTNVEELSKGYIYANYDAQEKIETEYQETIVANIGNSDLTDSIVLYSNVDNFVQDENTKGATTVNNVNYAYAKELKIEKEIFDKFISEDGYINLYKGETLISTINKETKANEENNIVVDLSEFDVNELKIETSKPKTEGKLKVEITKALKGDIGYNKNQMKQFTSLEVIASGKAINNNMVFNSQTVSKNIGLKDPKSVAELVINNTNLSTVVTNENVEIRAILKTNSLDYNLYKNPSLNITLPSYIESINVKSAQVLFNDELKIASASLVENADKTKSIVLQLEGTQTKYDIGNIAGGANIVLLTDITVNKLTPNTAAEVKMSYTNENVINQNPMARTAQVEQNETSATLNFTAPTGIVTMNSISGYKEGAAELVSISGEDKVATIDIMSQERQATFNMSVMNNYKNTIENVVILGRTPFAGNKKIESKEDLETTMNLGLTTPITATGIDSAKVKVYYSENGEATKDLNDSSNGWTETIRDLAKVKSYLIVTNSHVMNTADSITFNYNALIPGNLQHNQSAYQTYAVYFTNNLETGKVEDKQETAKVGVTTGKGPVLKAEITSNIKEGEVVLSGDIIKYTVTVKNEGDLEAENIKAEFTSLSEYLRRVNIIDEAKQKYEYLEDNSLQFGNIKVGESKTADIWFEVQKIYMVEDFCKDPTHYQMNDENDTEITGKSHKEDIVHDLNDYELEEIIKVKLTADNLEKEIISNERKINIKNSFFDVKTSLIFDSEEEYLEEGNQFKYMINAYSYQKTEETKIDIKIPNELEYLKVTENTNVEGQGEDITENINNTVPQTQENNVTENNDEEDDEIVEEEKEEDIYEKAMDSSKIKYDKENSTLQININGEKERLNSLYVYFKVKENEEVSYNKQVVLETSMSAKNINEKKTIKSKINLVKNNIQIVQTASIPENSVISDREEFQYNLRVKSEGTITGKRVNITIKDKIPEQLVFIKATKKDENGNESKLVAYQQEDNSVEINISAEQGKTIDINIYVKPRMITEKVEIQNVIEANIEDKKVEINSISHILEKNTESDIEADEEGQETKKISGQVWIDANKDGIKDEEETKVNGVEVLLLNNETGILQTNASGEIMREKTEENGVYTFVNVPQGEYTVIFLYDTANYSSATYKKDGIDEIRNSDAIDTQITLDGKKQTVAITEEIKLTDENIYNIDLGLIENPKFDLSLDKTVSKITVQDNTGTKTYNYEDSKLAKRDLVGKQVNSTTIVVEYKIKVTNEGAISGYVKKIADYIPSELKFSSELNRDWYQGENGTIYNASLANTLINPGETKEVTLLLTKKLTEDNLGLIQNSAEIYEAYNDLGIEDIDSKQANKQTDEDDYSSADILITVKTGETIIFIGLTLGIITTIAIGAYVIKRKIIG